MVKSSILVRADNGTPLSVETKGRVEHSEEAADLSERKDQARKRVGYGAKIELRRRVRGCTVNPRSEIRSREGMSRIAQKHPRRL